MQIEIKNIKSRKETNFPSVCTEIVASLVQWSALISINCIVVMSHLNLGRRFCSYTRDFVNYTPSP